MHSLYQGRRRIQWYNHVRTREENSGLEDDDEDYVNDYHNQSFQPTLSLESQTNEFSSYSARADKGLSWH